MSYNLHQETHIFLTSPKHKFGISKLKHFFNYFIYFLFRIESKSKKKRNFFDLLRLQHAEWKSYVWKEENVCEKHKSMRIEQQWTYLLKVKYYHNAFLFQVFCGIAQVLTSQSSSMFESLQQRKRKHRN